jgi:hypothetical protein
MKRLISLVAILALFVASGIALAQQASPGAATTQTGSTGLAAGNCLSNIGTSSVAITLTIPAPGGANSVYVDFLTLAIASTAAVTGSATPQTWTSTNIAGTPQFPISGIVTTSATNVAFGANGPLSIPLKGLVGVGPTFVSPTANTNFFGEATACWHIAP